MTVVIGVSVLLKCFKLIKCCFLPNETDTYTGKYLCKYNNGQKEKEGNYKDGKLEVNYYIIASMIVQLNLVKKNKS